MKLKINQDIKIRSGHNRNDMPIRSAELALVIWNYDANNKVSSLQQQHRGSTDKR